MLSPLENASRAGTRVTATSWVSWETTGAGDRRRECQFQEKGEELVLGAAAGGCVWRTTGGLARSLWGH